MARLRPLVRRGAAGGGGASFSCSSCSTSPVFPPTHTNRLLPATVHAMNQAQAAAAMTFLFSAIATNIAVGVPDFDAAVRRGGQGGEARAVPRVDSDVPPLYAYTRLPRTAAPAAPDLRRRLLRCSRRHLPRGHAARRGAIDNGGGRSANPPPCDCPSLPSQVLERSPHDLRSPEEVGLWLRYTSAAALEAAMQDAADARSGSGGSRSHSRRASVAPLAADAMPAGHPELPHGGDSSSVVSCPVAGGGGCAGSAAASPAPPAALLSPQVYATMDVEERTAVVHRHLPSATLHFLETVLQVRGGRGREGGR